MISNTTATKARHRYGTAGGKKVKIELISARRSKGGGRFDGVFFSKWNNKLRIIHRKKPSSIVVAKNLPLPPTLAVDDDVRQRDEKDGDISNTRNNNKCELLPSAMVMGSGGGVTTECVTNELLCGRRPTISSSTIHRQHCHQKQTQQRKLVITCCDDNNNDVYTTVTTAAAAGIGGCVDIKSQPLFLEKNDDEIVVTAEQIIRPITTNTNPAIPTPTTTTTTTTMTKRSKMLRWMRKQVPKRKVRSRNNIRGNVQVETKKLHATTVVNAACLKTTNENVEDSSKPKVTAEEADANTKPRTSHCRSLLDDDDDDDKKKKKNADNSMLLVGEAIQQSLCVEYTEADYKKAEYTKADSKKATKRGPRWLFSILRNSISNNNKKMKKKNRALSKKTKSTMVLDNNAPHAPNLEEKNDNDVAAMDVSVSSTKVTKGTRLSTGNIEVTESELLQHLNKIESELVELKNCSLSPITEEEEEDIDMLFVHNSNDKIEVSCSGNGYEIIDTTNPLFACVGFNSLMPATILNKIESDGQSMLSPGVATDAITRRITNGGGTTTVTATIVEENNDDIKTNSYVCENEINKFAMEEAMRMLYNADNTNNGGGTTVATNVEENKVIEAKNTSLDCDTEINKFACGGMTTFTHEGTLFSNESYERIMEEEMRLLYDDDDVRSNMTGRSETSSQEESRDDTEQPQAVVVNNICAAPFSPEKYNYAGKVIGIESSLNNNNNKGGGGSESSSDAKTYYTMESMDTMVRKLFGLKVSEC